jgi:hypothetical protein
MRVPALNPKQQGDAAIESAYGVPADQLRTYVLDVETPDGDIEKVSVVRPVGWVVNGLLAADIANEDMEQELLAEFERDNPWLSCGLNVLSVFDPEHAFSVLGSGSEILSSFPWQAGMNGFSPQGILCECAELGRDGYISAAFAEADAIQSLKSFEESILSGEAVGLELYAELPELGLEGWATLASVEPARSQATTSEHVDSNTHRLLKLLAKRDDGSTTKIELIRSLDWIRENLGAKASDFAALEDGSRLRLAIPELRLNGYLTSWRLRLVRRLRTGRAKSSRRRTIRIARRWSICGLRGVRDRSARRRPTRSGASRGKSSWMLATWRSAKRSWPSTANTSASPPSPPAPVPNPSTISKSPTNTPTSSRTKGCWCTMLPM